MKNVDLIYDKPRMTSWKKVTLANSHSVPRHALYEFTRVSAATLKTWNS